MKLLKKLSPMAKRVTLTIIALLVLIVLIVGIKGVQIYRAISGFEHMKMPPVLVSVATSRAESWQPYIESVGSMTAVQGITLSPQVSGVVTAIHFDSGAVVQKGQLLVSLDTDVLQAQLDNSIAAMKLAKINFDRQAQLYQQAAASKSDYDTALATLEQDQALVAQNQALLDQKLIRAPFAGVVSIRQISLGQYLNAGDPITSLQMLSPIFVDYTISQQELSKVFVGQAVEVTTATFPGMIFNGKVVAISSNVDPNTRSIAVRAELANNDSKQQLLPGMFVTIHTLLPVQDNVVTIPQSAVGYSLYGDSVYEVVPQSKNQGAKGKIPYQYTGFAAHQVYVTTGDVRGTDVAILKGLPSGVQVVTAGQIKLQEGTAVTFDKATVIPA